MDTTVLTPGTGQSVVAASDSDRSCWHGLIAAEQAAYGRQNMEGDRTICRDIKEAERNIFAMGSLSASHLSDRIFFAYDRLSDKFSHMEREHLNKIHDLEVNLLQSSSDTQKLIIKSNADVELRLAEQKAELAAAIEREGGKTRSQAADFRMRDLESKLEHLQNKLLNKP